MRNLWKSNSCTHCCWSSSSMNTLLSHILIWALTSSTQPPNWENCLFPPIKMQLSIYSFSHPPGISVEDYVRWWTNMLAFFFSDDNPETQNQWNQEGLHWKWWIGHLYLSPLHTKIQLKWQWNIISTMWEKMETHPKFGSDVDTDDVTHAKRRWKGFLFTRIMRHSEEIKVAPKWFENHLRSQEKETGFEFLLWCRSGAESRFLHRIWTLPQWQRREHPGFVTSLSRLGQKGKKEDWGLQAVKKNLKMESLLHKRIAKV